MMTGPMLSEDELHGPNGGLKRTNTCTIVIVQIGNSAKRNMESKKPMVIIHIL